MKLRDVYFHNPAFVGTKVAVRVPEAEIIDGLVHFTLEGVHLIKPLSELKQATIPVVQAVPVPVPAVPAAATVKIRKRRP